MNRPSSRHLSHDYEAYKGLSLRELFWIVLIFTPFTALIFILIGAFIDAPVAFGCVGFLTGFVLSITFCPKRIARLKAGKPHGHLMKKTVLLFVRLKVRQSPYLAYVGHWQKSKIRTRGPTSRGLSAGSMHLAKSLDSGDKPRNVGL